MFDYVAEQCVIIQIHLNSKFMISIEICLYLLYPTFVSHNKNIFTKMHSFAAILHLGAAVTKRN